jgi:DNA polymerase I-like protein with 3'-5' exonuclease and polymerase domains
MFLGAVNTPFAGFKCLATLHPASIFRMYEWKPLLNFDLRRGVEEAKTPTLHLPTRHLITDLSPQEIIQHLFNIYDNKHTISVDIEGGINYMPCLSIATSAVTAFAINFCDSRWTLELECALWSILSAVLADPNIPKIMQNALYDCFVLEYAFRCPVRGLLHDTMLAGWEMYSELPKDLETLASIYTREPYWKHEMSEGLLRYCCKDSSVTFEIANVLPSGLCERSKDHYRFNVSMLEPLLHMELRGMKYDTDVAAQDAKRLSDDIYTLQACVNIACRRFLPHDLLGSAAIAFGQARKRAYILSPDVLLLYARGSKANEARQFVELLDKPLTARVYGELLTLLGLHINVDSPLQLKKLVYETLGYKPRYKKEHGRVTDKQTVNMLSLLQTYKESNDPRLFDILQLGSLLTQHSNLTQQADKDGRIRCGYNVVGSSTGRVSCYASPTGSGYNLQTVMKKYRRLFRADKDRWFFECDLSGADGYTVAAHCASRGDRTMLEDYAAGIKPAQNLTMLHRGLIRFDTPSLEARQVYEQNKAEEWLYFTCKRAQHATNYGVGPRTMSEQILQDSYKITGVPLLVEPALCARLQQLYLARYHGVQRWQTAVQTQLRTTHVIVAASGQRRVFFGRVSEHKTLRDALAFEPQANTTYVTNRVLLRMWTDPENRESGRLIIEPLHQMHDALCGQFPQDRTEWALAKIRSYFNDALVIAGIPIIIPFEGGYGPSWGELNNKI